MKQFQTREELLQDAINYYWGRPERRCVNEYGDCQYIASATSEGCAIGRLLTPELAESLNPNSGIFDNNVWCRLPSWLEAMGQDFLHYMQRLHDGQYFVNRSEYQVNSYMETFVDMNIITFPE